MMQKLITVPALTVSLIAVAFALETDGLLAASDCVAEPNRASAQGGHWYYHVDRGTRRKCWYLTETNPPAKSPLAEPVSVSVQRVPNAPWQGSFSSLFSSLTSGFTTASVGALQPDTPNRDPRGAVAALPEVRKADDAAPKRRHRAYAKSAPVSKPDQQASFRPSNLSAGQPRSVSLSQADRDALFREFLRWKESQ